MCYADCRTAFQPLVPTRGDDRFGACDCDINPYWVKYFGPARREVPESDSVGWKVHCDVVSTVDPHRPSYTNLAPRPGYKVPKRSPSTSSFTLKTLVAALGQTLSILDAHIYEITSSLLLEASKGLQGFHDIIPKNTKTI